MVPLGLGAVRSRAAAAAARDARALRARASGRVLLSLSAKRPHKNLARADQRARADTGSEAALLVLARLPDLARVGAARRAHDAGVDADVRFPGWVSAEEIEGLWGLARAFVFPSFYEGFGLPVLEAMARGVPVACSDSSSLPEVAGEAAMLFDPRDEPAIAAAITRLLEDPAEAERLRRLGRARAAAFSWEQTARLTLDSYARALA